MASPFSKSKSKAASPKLLTSTSTGPLKHHRQRFKPISHHRQPSNLWGRSQPPLTRLGTGNKYKQQPNVSISSQISQTQRKWVERHHIIPLKNDLSCVLTSVAPPSSLSRIGKACRLHRSPWVQCWTSEASRLRLLWVLIEQSSQSSKASMPNKNMLPLLQCR